MRVTAGRALVFKRESTLPMATVQLCRFTRDAITNRRVGWQYLFVRSGAGSAIQMAMTRRLNCVLVSYRPLGRFFARTRRLVETRAWTSAHNFHGLHAVEATGVTSARHARDRREATTPRPTLTPPPNKTRRPTAVPEQYRLLTNLATAGPPAARAAAAASPRQAAAAAPVLG